MITAGAERRIGEPFFCSPRLSASFASRRQAAGRPNSYLAGTQRTNGLSRRQRDMHRTASSRRSLSILTILIATGLLVGPADAQRRKRQPAEATPSVTPSFDESVLQALEWRLVGPYRGGRVAAVAGIPQNRETYYFGATGGGVWKTTDGGSSWENVTDGYFGGSIGAVAVSEWDPNVVYVGGGEKTVRGNVSHGDGMWKSVDAGKTWTQIGLTDSRHISRIRIHPRDPDLVFVAAMGHLFGPNEERGVFRSKDGGTTWEKVLYKGDKAGAVDLAMDPNNPRVLYAALWQVKRTPYSLESGGEESGIWKSTDGGDSWTEITRNKGLPRGLIGIAGIAVSHTNSDNVWALVESENGGLFRSRDGGETWTRTSDDRSLRQRAWYYTRVYSDPTSEDSVYVLNVRFHHSKDGGKTFRQISVPHGDNHDLWIDPADPLRMVQSNDGGANVSYDGGETWSAQSNQPTAQMYRVSTDNAFPYRLLGGQQDNSALRIRSASAFGSSIGTRDWEPTAGGESGHIVAKPDEPDIVYGGSYGGFLVRVDHRTGEIRSVNVWPDDPMGWGAADLKYRFQWNFPIFFSPHDPDTLYAAAQVLFKTTDEGYHWEAISPDLTRNDKSTQGPSGGPITKDNTAVEYYGTIFAALESPHQPGVFWTGSDDGLIHVSRDGGENWADVTPADLPEWTMINSIEAHPFEEGGLYVAATGYKQDDFAPYLYRTTDWGQSWTKITDGIADDHFTRVIRADPDRAGLLYAGTERGVYISFDDGETWQSLQLNLPIVPITDLAVKEQDLVAATQGRSYWILDDLTPLHAITGEIAAATAHLFTPRPTHRLGRGGGFRGPPPNTGANPPSGPVFHYLLAETPDDETEIKLEIFEADGDEVMTYTRKPAEEEDESGGRDRGPNTKLLETEPGLNRFVWNMRYAGMERFPGMILWNDRGAGPTAVPGAYSARLTVGDWSQEVEFEILKDPRSSATLEDLQAQFDFVVSVRDKLTEIHEQIGKIRTARAQLEALDERLKEKEGMEDVLKASKALQETVTPIEEALYQTKNRSRQDPLNFPIRLNDKLAGLMGTASFGDARPTSQAYAVRDELFAAADAELAKLQSVWTETLPALNRLIQEKAVVAIEIDE
jgi:photosystem II stability/assembly factor-like uncharacterized protein